MAYQIAGMQAKGKFLSLEGSQPAGCQVALVNGESHIDPKLILGKKMLPAGSRAHNNTKQGCNSR